MSVCLKPAFSCSIEQDGRITGVEIFGFQKRYNPDKYYVSIVVLYSRATHL